MKPIYFISILLFFLVQCEKIKYTDEKDKPEFLEFPTAVESDSGVTISWKTNEACKWIVLFNISTQIEIDSIADNEFREDHSFLLTEILPGLQYDYLVKNWDFHGNGPLESDTLSFTTTANELSFGWEEYRAGDYSAADSLFDLWLQENPNNPSGISAMGWTDLKTGEYESAKEKFLQVYEGNSTLPLSLAGLSVTCQIEDEPEGAISYSERLLEYHSQWIFEYDESLNYRKIHLILADSYIKTSQLNNAQEEIDFLWEANNFDPNIPDSWKIDNVSYETYEQALVAAIEYIALNVL